MEGIFSVDQETYGFMCCLDPAHGQMAHMCSLVPGGPQNSACPWPKGWDPCFRAHQVHQLPLYIFLHLGLFLEAIVTFRIAFYQILYCQRSSYHFPWRRPRCHNQIICTSEYTTIACSTWTRP